VLPAILPPVWHQRDERLFDDTSLPLDVLHTVGLRKPPYQLTSPKCF
jgi:hypothetical protein